MEGKLSAEEEEAEAGVHRASQGTQTAIWRLTEGQGDALDSVLTSRSAKGRLDFTLQVSLSARTKGKQGGSRKSICLIPFRVPQTGNVENPWLSAMSSHFAYWSSADVALFILRAMHHQDVRLGAPKEAAGKASEKDSVTAEVASPSQGGPAAKRDEFNSASPHSVPEAPTNSPVWSPLAAGQAMPRGLSDPEDWW